MILCGVKQKASSMKVVKTDYAGIRQNAVSPEGRWLFCNVFSGTDCRLSVSCRVPLAEANEY